MREPFLVPEDKREWTVTVTDPTGKVSTFEYGVAGALPITEDWDGLMVLYRAHVFAVLSEYLRPNVDAINALHTHTWQHRSAL